MNRNLRLIGLLTATASLGACGGGGDDDGKASTYSITADISGLTASGLVLQNSGASVPVTSGATRATIATNVNSGTAYAVTVQTQPTGQNCTVANGSGTVSGNVSTIVVTCAVTPGATYSVGGSITGYTGAGLALRLNGQTDAAFNTSPASGANSFGFAAGLTTGTSYTVAVVGQPSTPTQQCYVNAGGAGTIGTANVSNVAVVCNTSAPFTVGGTITGLTGAGLQLGMGYAGATTPAVLDIAPNSTTFAFSEIVPANGAFGVGIRSQPAGQACVITRGRGFSPGPVTDVAITCAARTTGPLSGTYTILDSQGRKYLNFNADGTFTTAVIHNDAGCNSASDTRNGNGVEYGIFNWNQATSVFSLLIPPVVDTNGTCGLGDAGNFANSYNSTLQRVNDTLIIQGDAGPITATAVVGANPTTSLVGAFASEGNNGLLLVLHTDGTFLFAETQGRGGAFFNTQERGCYVATPADITFSVGGNCRPDGFASFDSNGGYGIGGFSSTVTSIGPVPYTIENASTVVIGPNRYRRSLPN